MSRLEWKQITITQAKELWSAGLPVTLCPCRCSPTSLRGIACTIHPELYTPRAKAYRDDPDLWKGSVEETSWDLMYTRWSRYNTSPEQGTYAHYYVQEAVHETCEAA
jgi:hypothetical protein